MRFLHGRNVHRRYCATAESGYLCLNQRRNTGCSRQTEQNRKDTIMAHSIASTRTTASLGHEAMGLFASMVKRYTDYRAYRQTVRELSLLSARDLADLGLHHGEIQRVAYESVYGTRR
jgi:uncharacterized protein YjiS (DUF1127 family)